LFASLIRATGNELTLERQLDEASKAATDDVARTKARAAERDKRVKEFTDLFGSSAGTPEGEFQASLPQALFLANAESIAVWLTPQHDNLTARLQKRSQPEQVAEEAYLSILSRSPTPEEVAAVQKHLSGKVGDVLALEQLVWSLIASSEFRLNH
jgi:hypothetical protein